MQLLINLLEAYWERENTDIIYYKQKSLGSF